MKKDNQVVDGEVDFGEFLHDLDRGRTAAELGEKLLEIISSVRETKKSGHVTLKIGASWDKRAEMLRVNTTVTSKTPQLDRPESLFFVTPNGTPTKSDPRQLALIEANESRAGVVDFTPTAHTSN
ncbi:hypothetical protein AALF15_01110 [Corynebacteriaceae bacterium 7-707]